MLPMASENSTQDENESDEDDISTTCRKRHFMCMVRRLPGDGAVVPNNYTTPVSPALTDEKSIQRHSRLLRNSTELGFKTLEMDKMNMVLESLKFGEAMVESCLKITKIDQTKNRGVIATKYLRKHTFLGLYPGILLPKVIADQRELEYEENKDFDSCYTFFFEAKVDQSLRSYLFDRFSIKAGQGSTAHLAFDAHPNIVDYENHKNAMGIMNHGFKLKNASPRVVYLPDKMPVIAFFACRDIPESSEILWDYNDPKSAKHHPFLKK